MREKSQIKPSKATQTYNRVKFSRVAKGNAQRKEISSSKRITKAVEIKEQQGLRNESNQFLTAQ